MGKRIMIVDDSGFMRMLIRTMLVKHGYEIVAEAENGVVAIEKYRMFKPDLVMLDITMPEINGIEALKAIKAEFPNVKAVMVSAMGQKPMVTEAIKAGASDFVIKPFLEEKVIDTIRGILDNK